MSLSDFFGTRQLVANALAAVDSASLPTNTSVNGVSISDFVDTRIAIAAAEIQPHYMKLTFPDLIIPNADGDAVLAQSVASAGITIDTDLNIIGISPGSYVADLRALGMPPNDSKKYSVEIFECDSEGNVVRTLGISAKVFTPTGHSFTFSTAQDTFIRFYINNEDNTDTVTFRCISASVTRVRAFPGLS